MKTQQELDEKKLAKEIQTLTHKLKAEETAALVSAKATAAGELSAAVQVEKSKAKEVIDMLKRQAATEMTALKGELQTIQDRCVYLYVCLCVYLHLCVFVSICI